MSVFTEAGSLVLEPSFRDLFKSEDAVAGNMMHHEMKAKDGASLHLNT